MPDTIRQLKEILAGKNSEAKEASNPTLSHDILSSGLPREELNIQRLTEKAAIVNGAGQETVTWTLSVIAFHILDKPDIQARPTAELVEAMPDPRQILPRESLKSCRT